MKVLIFIILLALPVQAHAFDEWTVEDSGRELANVIVQVIDWGQTRNIVNNPDKYYETNVFLGDHPSHHEVDRFFAITIVGHGLVSLALPRKYREMWQYVTLGVHTGNVVRNYNIGLKVDF